MKQRQDHAAGLAAHLAAGGTVRAWAEEHKVPTRTAYRWARLPRTIAAVERIRARALDRAIGRLSHHATAAAEQLGKLINDGESHQVKLSAARAVLADLMTASNFTTIRRRLDELERRVKGEQPRSDAPPAG